jgi:hypothetical protein
MCQSLGIRNETNSRLIDRSALIVAGVLFVGYSSVPFAILLKWVK